LNRSRPSPEFNLATGGHVIPIGVSAAMLVAALTAVAPPVLVVIAMVIAIVVSLAVSIAGFGHDAGGRHCNQPQHDTGSKYALCTGHKYAPALMF
jgi:hypothetical protein